MRDRTLKGRLAIASNTISFVSATAAKRRAEERWQAAMKELTADHKRRRGVV